MKKGVVYTAVTGGYDDFKKHHENEQFDYICFTDYEYSGVIPSPWLHVRLPPSRLNNKDLARYCKLNPHLLLPNYDFSIWIDGNIRIKSDLYDYVQNILENYDIASYDHWWRDQTEQEFYVCAIQGFDLAWNLKHQYSRYKEDGYYSTNFYENNVLFRNHMSKNIINMQNLWWKEYLSGGKRDQYSFTYSAFKSNVNIHSLGMHDPRILKKYFDYSEHTKKRPWHQFLKIVLNRLYFICFPWVVAEPKRKNLLL
ncbi:glycosyltransferase domain-containing protein [Kluyvera sp. STS39-E]|uniref:glycosyltransferase domain-containing protein n=1 Tax=Kluyvera sp. STS39-E TaxID=3234748 RepID=UPI0034C65D67